MKTNFMGWSLICFCLFFLFICGVFCPSEETWALLSIPMFILFLVALAGDSNG